MDWQQTQINIIHVCGLKGYPQLLLIRVDKVIYPACFTQSQSFKKDKSTLQNIYKLSISTNRKIHNIILFPI